MSKELETLECIKELYKERAYAYDDKVMHKGDGWSEAIQHYDNIGNCLDTIKQALLKAQEQEKVLEILFKKQVDLGWLWYCIHECVNSLNEYNKKMPIEKFKLTKEDFDLLERCFRC